MNSFYFYDGEIACKKNNLNKKTFCLLCCPIQAITRANLGKTVPGEGKIYILGSKVEIMLLKRVIHNWNHIIKPEGRKLSKCRHNLPQKSENFQNVSLSKRNRQNNKWAQCSRWEDTFLGIGRYLKGSSFPSKWGHCLWSHRWSA